MDGTPQTTENFEARDKRTEQGEILPEFQTLNSSRILKFAKDNGITTQNIDTNFNIDLCIKLTEGAKSATEKEMSAKIKNAKNILEGIGKGNLLMITDRDRFNSELSYLQNPPTSLTQANSAEILRGWEYVSAIREKARRLLLAEERVSMEVQGEKAGTFDGLMDGIKQRIGKIGENWDKWSTNQKLLFAAGALVSTIWFFKSENPTVKTMRDYLKTGVLALGGAWMGNKLYELITGKSLLDTATEGPKATTRQKDFFMEAFGTDQEHAELIAKSFSMIGTESFTSLLDKYQQGSATKKIEGTKMKAEEAYQAIDLFVSRFGGVERLKKDYSQYQPPITFNQVAVIEMSKDPKIKMSDNIASQVIDGAGNLLNEGYNYLATSGLALWFREKYRGVFKREATDQEVVAFAQRFATVVKDQPEMLNSIDSKIASGDVKIGKFYKETWNGTELDQATGVKYGEKSDGYTYLILEDEMASKVGNNQKLEEETKSLSDRVEKFVTGKYGVKAEDAKKNIETAGSIFVTATGKVEYFARYKRK